jgi:MerR HTH family regulatory protein
MEHDLFGLFSYSNFLFLPWANPVYWKQKMRTIVVRGGRSSSCLLKYRCCMEVEAMRLYSLGEVCVLFVIDPVTLRRWMHREHIAPHVDPTDGRRRYLDQAQLLRLARAHSRVLVPTKNAEKPSALLAHLCDEVATLARRLDVLEARQCKWCSGEHREAT